MTSVTDNGRRSNFEERVEHELQRELEASLEAQLVSSMEAQLLAQVERWSAANDAQPGAPSSKMDRHDDPRPVIRCTPELHEVVEQSIEALAASSRELGIYQRACALVHVTAVTRAEAETSPVISVGPGGEQRRELVAGTPVVHAMAVATLRVRMTRAARFEKLDKRLKRGEGAWVRCIPGEAVVEGVHAERFWPGIPTLAAVRETPFLRPDDTICQTPGFDPATGFLFLPSCDFPTVPVNPTRDDARRSYERLADLFCDFDFAKAEHSAVPISAILTYLARPWIRGATPAHALDGNVPGAGKGLIEDTVATVVTGRPMPRKAFSTKREEMRKVFDGVALQATPMVSIDNVDGEFGGGWFDSYMTDRTVMVRSLGKTGEREVEWNTIIWVNGNGLKLGGDAAPRILRCRLESPHADPRRRPASDFKYPDLLAHAAANRAQLVVDGLTILRAYVAAGRPDMGTENWGSYKEFAALVPPAIKFAGGPNVMDARIRDEASANPEVASMTAVVNQWGALLAAINRKRREFYEAAVRREKGARKLARELGKHRDNKPFPAEPEPLTRLTCGQAIEELYDENGALVADRAFNPMRESIEALCCPTRRSGEVRPTSGALSGKFTTYVTRNFGGLCLQALKDKHTKINAYWVEPAVEPAPKPENELAGSAGSAGRFGAGPGKVSRRGATAGRDTSRNGAAEGPELPALPAAREAAE